MKHFMPLLVALTALSAPLPALAQSSDRVLVIFGKDKCPTDSTGNEIVVCSRRPEAERYRIPKELRTSAPSPENQSWAARSSSTLSTGRTGTGSCSAVGAGGWTGCYLQEFRKAREEARANAAEQRKIP
jgi:hypothetical protein